MTKAEKLQFVISHIISLSILIGIVGSLYYGQWFNAFLAALALTLMYVPALFEWNYRVILPMEFEFMATVFIYASLYLGLIQDYFNYYWWWDILMHSAMGLLLGLVGFLISYSLNFSKKVPLSLNPLFICVFAFAFSMSIGALWEIYEFTIDNLWGLNWQESSLWDTMWDLIVDAIGALLAAIMGYFYIINVRVPLFFALIKKFVNYNPRIFKKW